MGLADAFADPGPDYAVRWRPAKVTVLPAGGKVTIKFAGDANGKQVPYLAWYTPVVNDIVMVLQLGSNQYLVLGDVA